nr:hypothetical protein [Tanacetum cinerariifolium]
MVEELQIQLGDIQALRGPLPRKHQRILKLLGPEETSSIAPSLLLGDIQALRGPLPRKHQRILKLLGPEETSSIAPSLLVILNQ